MTFLKTTFFVLAAFLLSGSLVPTTALAQQAPDRIGLLLGKVSGAIANLIPIIIGLGLIVFLWGVLTYVLAKGEDDKSQARSYMIWGIIGLFVMVAVWGLVNILADAVVGSGQGTRELKQHDIPNLPGAEPSWGPPRPPSQP